MSKGTKVSAEQRQRLRDALSRPEAQQRKSEGAKKAWADPESRARHLAGLERAWENPETAKRMSEAIKRSYATPEARKRKSEATKRQWEDPEVRARRSEAIKAGWSDPELRRRKGAAVRRHWADPEARKRMVETLTRTCSDPEVRRRKIAAAKRMWADMDDEQHAARVEAMQQKVRKVWAAVRAKQPTKRGRRQEAEQDTSYFAIGAAVERKIPATLKRDKHSLVTARKLVSDRTRLQFDVVAKYHKQYRRAVGLRLDRKSVV